MDPNALLSMLGGQADPEALARALRGQKALGLIGQLSGDRVLSPVGQTVFGDANRQQAQASDAAGARLKAALDAQKAAADEAYRRDTLGIQKGKLDLDRQEFAFKKGQADAPKPPPSSDELRKEFGNSQTAKDFKTVKTAYQKIQSTSDTGAGDISLVYGYMKLLDPGSTVREGEFATAANAGSAFEKVGLLYNKVLNGEKLPDAVRKQFKSESGRVFEAQRQRFNEEAGFYVDLAKKRGIDPTELGFGIGESPPAQGSDEDAAAKAWAASNPQDPRAAAILRALQAKGR